MVKYLIWLVSALCSLWCWAVVMAEIWPQSSPIPSPESNYKIEILNLPLLQDINKTFTFDLSISANFAEPEQKVTLQVDDCGDDIAMGYQGKVRTSIPLTLIANKKQTFPVILYRDGVNECILTFKLLDGDKNLLTSTQVGVLPGCPSARTVPIDQWLDYTLLELQINQPISSNKSNPNPSSSSASSTSSSVSRSSTPTARPSPTPTKSDQPLLTSTADELNAAFALLVEKGYLTEEDRAFLQHPLKRIQAAELFVNIAMSNGLAVSNEKTCTFKDTSSLSTDQQNIAQLACQLNIMGVHPNYTPLENFMPEMTIPSEQLVTAFSRLMWRAQYEHVVEEIYYTLHMNAMYKAGIINNQTINVDQTLADFVTIAARAFNQGQLPLNDFLPEAATTGKRKLRFW